MQTFSSLRINQNVLLVKITGTHRLWFGVKEIGQSSWLRCTDCTVFSKRERILTKSELFSRKWMIQTLWPAVSDSRREDWIHKCTERNEGRPTQGQRGERDWWMCDRRGRCWHFKPISLVEWIPLSGWAVMDFFFFFLRISWSSQTGCFPLSLSSGGSIGW